MQRYRRERKLRVTDFTPDLRPRPKRQEPDFTEYHRGGAVYWLLKVRAEFFEQPVKLEPWHVELCRALTDEFDIIDPDDHIHAFKSVGCGPPDGGFREYEFEAALVTVAFPREGSDELLGQLINNACYFTTDYNYFDEMPIGRIDEPIHLLLAQRAINRWRSFQGLPPLRFNPDAVHLMRAEQGLPHVDPLPPGYEITLPRPHVIVLGVR